MYQGAISKNLKVSKRCMSLQLYNELLSLSHISLKISKKTFFFNCKTHTHILIKKTFSQIVTFRRSFFSNICTILITSSLDTRSTDTTVKSSTKVFYEGFRTYKIKQQVVKVNNGKQKKEI